MKPTFLFVILVAQILLSSCTTAPSGNTASTDQIPVAEVDITNEGEIIIPRRPKPDPINLPEGYLSIAKQTQSEFPLDRSPANPNFLHGPKYKYGYFCGAGHPVFEDGPDAEKLISLYYSIEPWDEIDRNCRDHDLCWIAYGEDNAECNEQFLDSIRYMDRSFGERHHFTCSNVTSDIINAFSSIFVHDKYTSTSDTITGKFAKLVTTPILGLAGIFQVANVGLSGYPVFLQSDYCYEDGKKRAQTRSWIYEHVAEDGQIMKIVFTNTN